MQALMQAAILALLLAAYRHSGMPVILGFVLGGIFVFFLIPPKKKRPPPSLDYEVNQAASPPPPLDMSHRQTESFRQLLRCCAGNQHVADRLVAYEMALNRQLTPQAATAEALDRLLIDRRARY